MTLYEQFKHKHRNADLATVQHALRDVAATLDLHIDKPLDHPYTGKLWAEWDALIERKVELTR